MRAVVDPTILTAAVLSPGGAPARVLARWLAGEFELVVSDALLVELERTLAYPKLRARVREDEATAFVTLLRQGARVAMDPETPPARSADAEDDYLLALAEQEHAMLVSGDRHLLALAAKYPVRTARDFLATL